MAISRLLARLIAATVLAFVGGCEADERATGPDEPAHPPEASMSPAVVADGKQIFRFDTFGNETFWSDTAALHEKVNLLSPLDALMNGLKVDFDALPAPIQQALLAGQVDLTDPATTAVLIQHDAVLGVKGQVENGSVVRIGITCALCHSTVDDAIMPGVGSRLDGWPNRDLDVGAIIALSDAIADAPYNTWGPGMYDPRFSLDGINIPVVLPPAFGLRHVKKELYTGDDDVSYWNTYVAVTQMHGHGTFVDPRINVAVSNPPDLVSSKLDALRAYQFSLETPAAKPGTFDPDAARRGRALFRGVAGCGRCHRGAIYSDINANRLHSPDEVGQDGDYAFRSVTKLYRTTPLRGLWNPPQLDGPYFHDGSAPTLADVVDHYVALFGLTLSTKQKSDLVEFLKTL
jgi:mono/diheme cytochrome c family protein